MVPGRGGEETRSQRGRHDVGVLEIWEGVWGRLPVVSVPTFQSPFWSDLTNPLVKGVSRPLSSGELVLVTTHFRRGLNRNRITFHPLSFVSPAPPQSVSVHVWTGTVNSRHTGAYSTSRRDSDRIEDVVPDYKG